MERALELLSGMELRSVAVNTALMRYYYNTVTSQQQEAQLALVTMEV